MQRKRQNTTKACEECRRRRAKCDGIRPRCSRCVNRFVACLYTPESDGRKAGSKSNIESLRNRIDVLERALKLHDIDLEKAVAQVLDEYDLEDSTGESTSRTTYSRSVISKASEKTSSVQPDQPVLVRETEPAKANSVHAEIEGSLTIEESLNFDQDGEKRYFGPTSGRLQFQTGENRVSIAEPDPLHPVPSVNHNSQGIGSKKNQLIESVMEESRISQELQDHLFNMYFTWEQPWCWVINEKLFRESQQSGGRYSSPLLVNCILAIASRYTDRLEVRSDTSDPSTAGRLFLDSAEVLLHYDLKWPTITTIQSLSIMGTIYVAQGADAAGWLHQGMANRLAIDMGLNLDVSSLRQDSKMSVEEIDLRRQIYWALYCVDKLSAAYTGRVCTFLDCQGMVNLPRVNASFKGREDTWSFNADEDYPLFTVRTSFSSLHYSLISLCRILERILSNLYAPKPACNSGQHRIAFRLSCTTELRNWYHELPPELCIDSNSSSIRIPHVFTTHMVYHTAIILLHKPFLDESRENNVADTRSRYPDAGSIGNTTVKEANMACYEAASSICAASQKYREMFGTFRRSPLTATHCNLMAALIFLRKQQRGTEMKESPFDTCAKVLQELSESWNPAGRLLENVLKLRKSRLVSRSALQNGPANSTGIISTSPSKEFFRIPIDNVTNDLAHSDNSNVPESWAESSHSGLDISTTDIDMMSVPWLVSDDLTFPFDSLPSDYGAFEHLHNNSVW